PLDLGKRQEDVFVCQQRMLAPARLLDCPVDNPLSGFGNLAGRDIEIVYVHDAPPIGERARRAPAQRVEVDSKKRIEPLRSVVAPAPTLVRSTAVRKCRAGPPQPRWCSRASIRRSVGGCVLKSDPIPASEKGLMMNM